MKNFSEWVFEHNESGKMNYILSLFGLFCYFCMFTVLVDGTLTWITVVMGLFVVIASYNVGRCLINRYLYMSDENMLNGHVAISSVVRFHAFDADDYFAGMQKKLHMPFLWIVAYALLPAAVELIAGEKGIVHVLSIIILGVLGIIMVYVSYRIKKMLFIREITKGTDTAFSDVLKVVCGIFRVFEAGGLIIGSVVTFVILWLFLGAVLEPEIDEAKIIFRSYTGFNAYIFLIMALVIFMFGMIRHNSKKKSKILFILSGICLVATVVLTYAQTRCYVEITDNKFSVYNFGLVREYDFNEVESFRVYADEMTQDLDLELKFNDGNSYKAIGSVTSCSSRFEEQYYSYYNFVADLAGKMLGHGVKGTLEDRDKLEANANELHEKVQEGWRDITSKMD